MSRSSSPHPTPETRKRLICSLLSAIIPGTGQILAGKRRRGIVMLFVTLLIIAGVLAAYMQGTSTLLSWLVQPRILVSIFVLNIIILLFRLGAIIDAYFATSSDGARMPSGWRGALVITVLAVILAVSAAPHAVLGYYTYLTHDTLTSVFSTESFADPEPEPTATPEPTPEPASMSD